MPTPVKMPKLGMTMREGTVVEWPVALGDAVQQGDVVCVIETEKAEATLEAAAAGTLRHLYVEVGQTVACGTLLAALTDTADEAFDAEAFRAVHDTPEASPPTVSVVRAPAVSVERTAGAPIASAQESVAAPARRPVAPAARARANELGIDVDAVAGSGPGGRVTRADVDAYAAARAALVRVADGVALEVPSIGEGDALLLLPGFGSDASSYAPQVLALAQRYCVRAMNPRGIGASDRGGDEPITPRTVADDAAALLEGPTHVVGTSFGAAAAVELAIARPDRVRSLVLITPSIAPSARLLAVLDAWTRLVADAPADTVAAAMLPWLFSERFLRDAPAAARAARGFAAMTRRTPAEALRGYADGLRTWLARGDTPDLGRITATTLVVAAGEDLLIEDATAVATGIDGARLAVIERAGHAVGLEAPDEVNRAIAEHLRGA